MYRKDEGIRVKIKKDLGKIGTVYIIISAVVFICLLNNSVFSQVRKVKIGAVSIEGTLDFNTPLIKKITEAAPLVAAAGRLQLDLVIFPEDGFRGKFYRTDAQVLKNSIVMDSMSNWAARYHTNIIFQVFEKDTVHNKLYNTDVVINRKGKYIGKYRKVNLPPEEINEVTPGKTFKVFNLDFGRVGTLTCWDSWFTNPEKILVDKGAELIVIPTWSNCQKNLETIIAENGVPVSYSVLKAKDEPPYESMTCSVFNQMGVPVFKDYPVGKNKIAVGTVTIGNYKNLALGRKIRTSFENNSSNPASNLVDGKYSTERDAPLKIQTIWKASSLPQWIEIDLDKDYKINRISIAQFDGSDYNFRIEGKASHGNYKLLSNSVSKYETILEHGIAGSEIYSSKFKDQKVRYVRINLDSKTKKNAVINELKVFGYLN